LYTKDISKNRGENNDGIYTEMILEYSKVLLPCVIARQGYQQNIPCGATAPLVSSCRVGVPEREDPLLEPTPSCTIFYRKKTTKVIRVQLKYDGTR